MLRLLLSLALLALAGVGTVPRALGAAQAREVRLLEIDGIVNALTARYLERELESASGAELVVLELDTPGGLERSMRDMTQTILNAPVPVVVYVAPSGARAASAGMFVTIAAHVAAMAPGTNIGAAHPVGAGLSDEIMAEKVTSDAAALARALAQARGRNAAWVESAVRESVSISADEALREGVIDLVSPDLDALLAELDGREVAMREGPRTLDTSGARVVPRPLSLPDRILLTITDPNIAYLLFLLGLLGIGTELLSPGLVVPGVAGGIALLLSFVAFGSLPLNWAGVALIAVAVALFAAELHSPGLGVLGAGGLVAFILGSLLLYDPTSMLRAYVSPWLVLVMAGVFAGFFAILLRAVVRARRMVVTTGIESLLGSTGVALSELAPEGTVRVNSEDWHARSNAPVQRGEAVRVTRVEGVTLHVAPAQGEAP